MTAPAHQDWPDIARGAGILFVVFGHSWRGLETAGLLADGPLFRMVDNAVYAFHMPLFFFLSGWFFPKTLARTGQRELAGRLFWRMLYPMCIWTYVFLGLKLAIGTAANTPALVQDLARWPIPGYLHLWFLWALFVIQAVAVLLRPVAVRGPVLFYAGMAAVGGGLFLSGTAGDSAWLQTAIRFAPYFCLGALCGLYGLMPTASRAAALAPGACVAFALALAAAVIPGPGAGPAGGRLAAMVIAVVAVLSLLVLIRAVAQHSGWFTDTLRLLGQYSMTIYLMHTIFSAAVRILLENGLGVTALGPHLVLSVLAGALLPLAVHLPAVPPVLRRVLGLPGAVLPFPRRPSRPAGTGGATLPDKEA